MRKIKESVRIKEIENKWNDSIEALFHRWHWEDNLMHKEIGNKLNIPRSTITRWFNQLAIPSQDSHRITNQNLLNVGSRKGPRAKPKVKREPCFFVDKEFFKRWTPGMAYVLGYFAADGCMFINPRGSHYIDFTSTERELIEKIRKIIKSNHAISVYNPRNPNWSTRYRLQIGSKEMFRDLLRLGFTPRKSKKVKFPDTPPKHLSHFIRGYFDGDGCAHYGFYNRKDRKKPHFILMTRFSCGNKKFLEDLFINLKRCANIKGGCIIYKKDSGNYDLQFSIKDSIRLYKFMYEDIRSKYFLKRKYNIFQEAIGFMGT